MVQVEAGGLVEQLGGLEGLLVKLLQALAIMLVGATVAVVVRSVMRRNLSHRLPPYIYRPMESLVFYLLLAVSGVAALAPFGINPSALLVAGGFAGIVVGLAAQNTLGNLVAGVMLLIEQPLRVGDPVNVAGVSGVVANISVFSTEIRTWDGPLVRIPNSTVFNEMITNYVKVRARRVELLVGIHYDSDIEKAREALLDLMQDHPFCLVNPAPEAFVEEYGDSSIVIRARCWAPPQAWFATKVDLTTRVKETLDSAGVVIPYPQRDIHLVSPGEIRVRLTGSSREGCREGGGGEGEKR